MKILPILMLILCCASVEAKACLDEPPPEIVLEEVKSKFTNCIKIKLIYPKGAGHDQQFQDVFVSAKSQLNKDYYTKFSLKVQEYNAEKYFSTICLSDKALDSTIVRFHYTTIVDEDDFKGFALCGVDTKVDNFRERLFKN